MFVKLTGAHQGSILWINPKLVEAVEETEAHPNASTVAMRSGAEYIVAGTPDETAHKLMTGISLQSINTQ